MDSRHPVTLNWINRSKWMDKTYLGSLFFISFSKYLIAVFFHSFIHLYLTFEVAVSLKPLKWAAISFFSSHKKKLTQGTFHFCIDRQVKGIYKWLTVYRMKSIILWDIYNIVCLWSHLMQSTSRVKSLSRPPRYLIYFLFTFLHTVDHFDTEMATKSHSSASAESGIHLCAVLSFSQGF